MPWARQAHHVVCLCIPSACPTPILVPAPPSPLAVAPTPSITLTCRAHRPPIAQVSRLHSRTPCPVVPAQLMLQAASRSRIGGIPSPPIWPSSSPTACWYGNAEAGAKGSAAGSYGGLPGSRCGGSGGVYWWIVGPGSELRNASSPDEGKLTVFRSTCRGGESSFEPELCVGVELTPCGVVLA